ncbi:MAG: hypothetical protein IIA83_10465 [Thaumarchaeota archaeon]|nr:hypothetical protein [Nitrososphaerota archaeon]
MADIIKEILKNTSISLPYTENEAGKGRLDVLAAINSAIRPQSKIVNNGNFNVTGNLIMILQKKISGSWQDVQIVTNQQVTIPENDLIKLDVGGTYGWNLQNVQTNSEGDYRAYASFDFDNKKIEATWEFKVVSSMFVPPPAY